MWCGDVRWPELALLLPMGVRGRQLGARWIRAATCLVYFIVVLPCLVPGMLACMVTVGLLGREWGASLWFVLSFCGAYLCLGCPGRLGLLVLEVRPTRLAVAVEVARCVLFVREAAPWGRC